MPMDGSSLPARIHTHAPIICLSHLRWNSVFQRPQQLMSRFAREREVYYLEEPLRHERAALRIERCGRTGVVVVTPMLPEPFDAAALRPLLDALLARTGPAVGWYYTPMALDFSAHVPWLATVFDCMDELSAFRFAPAELRALEARLLERADVVFTGGASLFEAKRHLHHNIHCMPSGVDLGHFMTAREALPEPAEQAALPRPLLGYFGVIDERLDMALLAGMARLRPDWHFAMIGPVAKLRPEELPALPNIHWLGQRDHAVLPQYLAHWDLALMPFAMNEATRFISPTKAPEYLAGGKRVVSTPIVDVVNRFAGIEALAIAADAQGFVHAAEALMAREDVRDFVAVDGLLARMSWSAIQGAMDSLLGDVERPALAGDVERPALAGDVERSPSARDNNHGAASRRPEPQRPIAAPALHTVPASIADHLVVGAGFAGAVVAERLAASGARVLVVDRRPHVAGNAFDEHDAAGVLVHRYGPHIFHTNSDQVLDYLSRFTEWRPYEHRVLAQVPAGLVPMPINRTTLSRVFGVALRSEAEAEAFLASLAEPTGRIASARDFVVSNVGSALYRMFFHGYTLKQWGLDPAELDRSVTARVPTRTSEDDRYFLDRHQCMPRRGYTAMFENMLDHPNITLLLGTGHGEIPRARYRHMVFTGPIDGFYGHRFGPLPYRSLVFEHATLQVERCQPVATINYPGLDTPYTRCTEFKHITGQVHRLTSICREIPSAEGEPYYPVPNPANQELFRRYQALADAERGVTFLGRLGSYRYLNMDQVVAQALTVARRLVQRDAQPARASARGLPQLLG